LAQKQSHTLSSNTLAASKALAGTAAKMNTRGTSKQQQQQQQ
jgi:hypothetical protein